VANSLEPKSREKPVITARSNQLALERTVKILLSVIFTGRIFPGFSFDDHEDVAKTRGDPEKEEYEEKQGRRAEPFVQFKADEHSDDNRQHHRDADAGEDTERFEQFLPIIVHGQCLYIIVKLKIPRLNLVMLKF
jgi:hypothetical protein